MLNQNPEAGKPAPIISPQIRIRLPEHFSVGEGSIVDDFCYFSTRIVIGRFCHVASGCSIAGGPGRQFTLGDYSSLSSGVKIWCTSNDFSNDIITIRPPQVDDLGDNMIRGDVSIGRLTGVGSNSVVMPDNHIPEGTVIGALSFVPARYTFEPWAVYAGIPIRFIKRRNRDNVLAQLEQLERGLQGTGERPS